MSTPNNLYTAIVEVTGGRGGTATSRTGELNVNLARPAERGSGEGTDPEELFAAAYAACFDSSLAVVARRERLPLAHSATTAAVSLQADQDQRYSIGVELTVRSTTCPTDTLRVLVAAADQTCPYSKALRGNVDVSIVVEGADE